MITNPGASRTLDPTGRSLVSIVGLHDKNFSDADENLIQSLQDWKRKQLLKQQACSGALTFAPFSFTARTASAQPLAFQVPAFNALMDGEFVRVGGNLSSSLDDNLVLVPAPVFWSPGSSAPQASLYVAYVEFWYQRLNPITGTGYYVDANSLLHYYPNGCVNAAVANMIANDALDPFMPNGQQETSERVQLQWAIRVTAIDPAYDFTQYSFGLDPGATSAQTVYGQAGQAAAQSGTPYQFTNMASINGDAGLWRSGDGNYLNELGTLDGYSYAIPLAIIFQRNTGVYQVDQNPFGTSDAQVPGSGSVVSGWTARYDGKYADVVYPEDVIDTRSLVSLTGWDHDALVRQGFVDVISGQSRLAIVRGETPGNLPIATGSLLDYVITVGPQAVANTDTIGAFDGYRNGFSSADQTFVSSQPVTVNDKATGTAGGRWQQGDSFTIELPGESVATIEYAQVQALVDDTVNSLKTPVLLLSGQIAVTGLGTKAITVTLAKDLTGTSYDPGLNSLYVTLGVEYPANGGMDLMKVPNAIYGGNLVDADSGKTLPVFGVSDYAVEATIATVGTGAAIAYNPNYSNLVFGARVSVTLAGSTGVTSNDANGNPLTTFQMNRGGLPGQLTGLYVISAVDQVSGVAYPVVLRQISGMNFTFAVQATVDPTSTLVITLLAGDTAQLSFSAPVKAVTAIEETIVAGSFTDANLRPDPRVQVISVKNYPGDRNVLVLATTGGSLTGIAGDDVNKFIWVQDLNGNFNAVQVAMTTFANGFVTLNVPPSVNLETQAFFLICALAPAFNPASSLTLVENYVPYQGEGRESRDYEILHTENTALVTTNGTGAAPVPGLKDVYPYNRELPISTTLPSQVAWSDATLTNQPVTGLFDSNYVAKTGQNIEHTFEVPAHTNDFVEPISDDKRKSFQLSTPSGGRGYAKAVPHMGFAITPVTQKITLGAGVTATLGALTVYVNNATGNDSNDGLTVTTPFRSLAAALDALPSVLRHPCSIQLIPTGQAYSIAGLQASLQIAVLGDGVVRSAKYYALGVLNRTIQESGRLVITAQAGTSGLITIDATGFAGFGDGPTSAFFVDSSRVIFNQIEFKGFTDPAVKGIDADVEFVNCAFTTNLQAASFENGSTVIMDGCTYTLDSSQVGVVLSQSDIEVTGATLHAISGATPGAFFVVERASSLTLNDHSSSEETNITASTLVAQAELNSSIVVTSAFTSQGQAAISKNSVLSRTVAVTPFNGGITEDTSSNVTTAL